MPDSITKKLQACETEMLRKFIEVCDLLKIRYYIVGGTLLGAVRHRGFIPWDDDIDICMPRSDYEQFIAKGQKYMPEYYFIQTYETDKEWPGNFAKIRDSRTTFIESSVKNCKINHGVYIDIFPMDNYPDGIMRRIITEKIEKICKVRIGMVYSLKEEKASFLRRTVRFLRKRAALALFPKIVDANTYRDKVIKSIPKGKMCVNYSGIYGKKEIMPYSWYGDGCLLEFEGLTVRAPIEYKKWLTQIYGDYMTLPPVEKRVAHHYNEVIDLDKPYHEYVSEDM